MGSNRRRLLRVGVLVLSIGAVLAAWAAPASAATTAITSAGPLTRVEISDELNCAVDHVGDTRPEFFGDTACATLAVVDDVLYGPTVIPAGGSAFPRTPWTAVGQSGPTGTGSAGDPFEVVTVVAAGETGITLTQTDSYVVGQESYRTDVAVKNTSGAPKTVRLYRAGDCYLQDSDVGFGAVDTGTGAVSCVGVEPDSDPPVRGTRIEQWFPISAGSHYMEDDFDIVWAAVGSRQPFPDTCKCSDTDYIDNGAGLSWDVAVAAGATGTVSSLITFSPVGNVPLSTTKTADAAQSAPGAANGYTIKVSNPNSAAVTLDAITDTLPAGFAYTAGSSTGATTADPTVNGQTLRWSGPFTVPEHGDLSLAFGVTVSSTPGTYTNEAGAESADFTVAPTGPTAPVEVTGEPPENQAPVAQDQAVAVAADTPEPITLVATDDGLPSPPAALTYAVVTAPAHGTLSGSAPALVYTPDPGYTGADSFTFKANDGALDSNVATVTITVEGGGELAPTDLFAMNALSWRTRDGMVVVPHAWVRLTDAGTGEGLAGREVVLSVGGEELCRATTGPHGWAHCGGTVAGGAETIAGGYEAAFAGDDTYAPSSDHGTLFELRRRCHHGPFWWHHWHHGNGDHCSCRS